MAGRAITDVGDALSIDVQGDAAALSDDRQEIGLVQTGLDGRAGPSLEDMRSAPSKTVQFIGPICFYGEVVVWAPCPNLAKEQAPSVSFEDRHLHLKGKVGKTGVRSITREHMSPRGDSN